MLSQKIRASVCVFALLFVTLFAEKVIVNDPLQGSTIGEIFPPNITVTAEGLQPRPHPNPYHDHILYRLPEPIEEGRIEFEIKGMPNKTYPKDEEHSFFGMYNGRGITEPCKYSPDFKFNYNRFCLGIRDDKMFTALNTARNNDEDRAAPRAVMTTRLGLADKKGQAVTWDPTKWHKVVFEWKRIAFRITVDGETYHVTQPHIDYFITDNHRIWLGASPGNGVKYANNAGAITYRNFKVISTDDNIQVYEGNTATIAPITNSQTFFLKSPFSQYKFNLAGRLQQNNTKQLENISITIFDSKVRLKAQ